MLIKLIVGEKVHIVTRKLASITISMAKQKYKEMNVNAIVAVEKDGCIVLQKDVYDKTDAFDKAVKEWTSGGYKCYFIKKGGK